MFASVLPAATVYQTGFETSGGGTTFTAGNLNSQGGWTVTDGTASVTNAAGAQAGSQYVTQGTMSTIDLATTAAGASVIFVEAFHKGAGTASPQLPPASPLAAAVLAFHADPVTPSNYTLACLNGSGTGNTGSTFQERAPAVAYSSTAWTRIVLRIDYAAKKWDCLVNGHTYLSNLGFRDNTVTALNGFRSATEVGSSLDTFSIKTSAGDLDGDGYLDTYEINPSQDTDPTDPASRPSLGNVNPGGGAGQDSVVDLYDSLLLFRIVNGQIPTGTYVLQDVDQSGAVDSNDATKLFKFVTGDPTVPTLPAP